MFSFVGKKGGERTQMSSTKEDDLHRARSDELIDALQWEDAGEVLKCLRKLDRIDGEVLEIIIKLLDNDAKLKPFFQNRLKIVRWSRGPLKPDPGIHSIIRKQIQSWCDNGLNLKKAIHKAEMIHGLSRSSLMKIWTEKPKPKSG
jgi:hypothetical protein